MHQMMNEQLSHAAPSMDQNLKQPYIWNKLLFSVFVSFVLFSELLNLLWFVLMTTIILIVDLFV